VNVVLIDDERRARVRLARLLTTLEDVRIAGEASDGIAAVQLIEDVRPHAAFVDVQMPGMSGLDVVAHLPPDVRPLVVFITAFDDFAVSAFEVNAVDYLMKPVDVDRLRVAVTRLHERLRRHDLSRVVNAMTGTARTPRIVGDRLGTLHVLATEDIDAFVADRELVFAITANGRFLVRYTLRDLEGRLDSAQFARVHKGTIVNLSAIHTLEPQPGGGAVARLRSGYGAVISRRFAHHLRGRLEW
jgi:two-component system LytT family response regulator